VNMNNSTNKKKSVSALDVPIGTRRGRWMKKLVTKNLADAVSLSHVRPDLFKI
jgi:hypothetical protein